MTAASQPYLSVICCSRNDNYGGNLVERMTSFLRSGYRESARVQVLIEWIVVEWNPPADRPRFTECLPRPPADGWSRLRIITVSAELHARFQNPLRFPLFEMIGKNVGLRRARGTYLLATNADLIYSSAFFEQLRQRALQPGQLYRIDRINLDVPVLPAELEGPTLQDFCAQHGRDIHGRFDRDEWSASPTAAEGGGDTAVAVALEPPHTNACGDFTLMHRDHWFALRGYPEIISSDAHVDGLAVYAGRYLGLQVAIFRRPVVAWHIFHDSGFSTPGAQATRRRRRSLDYETEYMTWCRAMVENGPLTVNTDAWGWAYLDLEEAVC